MKRLAFLIYIMFVTASSAATISTLAAVTSSATGQCGSYSFSDGPDGADDFGSFVDSCTSGGVLGADVGEGATVSFSGDAYARALYGSIGVSAGAATITQQSTRDGINVTADAVSYFSDVVHPSVQSGTLVIPLDLMGDVGATIYNFNSSAFAFIFAEVNGASGGNIAKYEYGDAVGATFGGRQETGNKGVNELSISFVDGVLGIFARLTAKAQCQSGISTDDPFGSTLCNGSVDFAASLRFLGARVYDDQGLLVGDATLRSDSGFDYARGVEPHITPSPVPLPASGLLMIVALLVLFTENLWRRPRNLAKIGRRLRGYHRWGEI